MRLSLFVVAVFAALGACSPPENDAIEPATAPVALPPGRPAIYEAGRVGPEAFVRALYTVYATSDGMGDPLAPGQDPIYDRMLNAMIGADFAQAGNRGPTLNYDPICGCQDSEGLILEEVNIAQTAPTAAEAEVVFVNGGVTKRQTLKLVKEGPMWKVSDVLVPGRPALTEQLMAAIS